MKLKKMGLAALTVAALSAAGPAAATSVGLELMLLVDVSGSVDASEYNLQKQGYVNAFNSAAVQDAILKSQGGKIAVTYIEWSGATEQKVQVDWTLIDSVASAQVFATLLNGTSRAFTGSTAVQDAIGKTFSRFGTEVGAAANSFESLRQVIDVSGDGADNDSASFTRNGGGRNAALAAGVDAINGIDILGEAGLSAYYNNFVKGGATGFVIDATGFNTFAAAIERKLVTEILQVPEPSSALLVGLAGLGLAWSRRRTAKA